MANVEFGTGKTMLVLSIVGACFAVLWPKIFYPMITGTSSSHPNTDSLEGCCDVLFENDINAFKIMTEVCGGILNRKEYFDPKLTQAFQQGKLNKEIINMCRKEVMDLCGIDIAEFLNKKEKLGRSYKQMLDEIRSFNITICLRQNFGISPGLLGAPRRMRIWVPSTPNHMRQERPLHFRPEMLHPALREKGRAIPQSQISSKTSFESESMPGPPPMPGMRPPMGGAGHVVPPPKTGGSISVIMPLYTVGIIIFFLYTVMKVFTNKRSDDDELKHFHSDPEFRRMVFSDVTENGTSTLNHEKNNVPMVMNELSSPQIWKSATDDSTRLGWKERYTIMSAITGLLSEVNQQLNREGETQKQFNTNSKPANNIEDLLADGVRANRKKDLELPERLIDNHDISHSKENLVDNETVPKVKVMGMEMMAGCEGGKKWNCPLSPNLGVGGSHGKLPAIPDHDSPEPQNIFLEGTLPQQSQLLVSDSKTQAFTVRSDNEPDPPVILSSKMTLSLINCDTGKEEGTGHHDQVQEVKSVDVKGDDENLAATDSTLRDVDSEVIDSKSSKNIGNLNLQQRKDSEGTLKLASEILEDEEGDDEDDESAVYGTPIMSGRGHAMIEDDTVADISNLDLGEDEEDLPNEVIQIYNGNAEESRNELQREKEEEEEEEEG